MSYALVKHAAHKYRLCTSSTMPSILTSNNKELLSIIPQYIPHKRTHEESEDPDNLEVRERKRREYNATDDAQTDQGKFFSSTTCILSLNCFHVDF